MNNLFNIKDNVTVITGGTGVLGRAIAKYLALEGAKVIILGRKEEIGNAIVEEITKEGGCCEFMKTDVMDKAVVQQNCDDIIAKYGRIDTLLNAAGGNMPGATIPPDKNFFDLQVDQFQSVVVRDAENDDWFREMRENPRFDQLFARLRACDITREKTE